MNSIFIYDGSDAEEDIQHRKQIKNICKSNSVQFRETLDTQGVTVDNADIIIVHLGFATRTTLSAVGKELQEIKSITNPSALIIGVSSSPDFIDKSRECGFPAFYYFNVIRLLKKAIEESKLQNKNFKLCLEEIFKNYKQITNIIRDFLPLNIDIQALSDKKVINKIKYLKEMLKDTEKGFYTKKLEMVNNLINEMVNGNNKDKINDLFTKDNYIKEFLNRLDEIKEKIDTLKEEDVHNRISHSSTNFPSFYHWYTFLVSCLRD